MNDSSKATLIMYADDMMIGSSNKEEVQTAIKGLEKWTEENYLHINKEKTVQMVFRKGGKQAKRDKILLNGDSLEIVNKYKYLGITLQTTGRSFKAHVREKSAAAIRSIYKVRNITKLSTDTAMLLFNSTIAPIVTYGIEIVWEKLTLSDLTEIEKVKAYFMKRAMGVSKTSPSRLVYVLMKESLFIDDIRAKYLLPSTGPSQKLQELREMKRKEIEEDFYNSSAICDRSWTKECQDQRHVITRLAVHGFHHKICRNTTYHKPNNDCICSLCEQKCSTYHITVCPKREKTISEYSRE